MRTVSQDEASQRLPDLLREANRHSVVICEAERELGALISMEDYEIVRAAKAQRFLDLCDRMHLQIAKQAEADGMSLEDLEKELLEG